MISPELKDEAIRRMKMLKLLDNGYDSPVADFRKDGSVWKSEFHGILYYLDSEEEKIVKQVEEKYKKYNMKVYHCYKAHTDFGEILFMLYVSNDEKSPRMFDSNLKRNVIYLYAYNMSEPAFSEFGTMYIHSQYGGIVIR